MEPKTTKSEPFKSKPIKVLAIAARVFAILTAISFSALLISVIYFNILPLKYLLAFAAIITILAGVNIFLSFFKKQNIALKIISLVLSFIFLVASIFGLVKVIEAIGFFSNFGTTETTNTYNVLVANESTLNEDSDLSGYDINVYRDLTLDSDLVAEVIANKFNARAIFVDNLLSLITESLLDTSKVIAINSGTYEAFLEDNDAYKNRFRVIDTFEITVATEDSSNIDVTTTPFSIYISGIDTRTGTLPSRSLSDVNIVVFINPVEHKVLMVSIPRDYYVHLAGTPGDALGDKLTHAGSMGGVALSKATVEELLGVDIDFYVRVNFNFVSQLVDAIGGINVYSDVDYSFRGYNDPGCVFYPGYNYVYGQCALAFSRERRSYSDGDRHRGKNQEQVIGLILEKVTSSSTLLSSYSDILASLSGTFETNFGMDDVTKFIRAQLENMSSWTVDSQNLDGVTGGDYTYSYPYQTLSVMYQDEESVATAKAKIAEFMGLELAQ